MSSTNGTGAPRFKLFSTANSPFTRKAILVLKSLGLNFQTVEEDPETASQEFQTLGPIRRFPVLVDAEAGAVVPDSTLILEYIQDTFGGVWSKDNDAKSKLRARVLEDEADLLIEETNRMANDQLLANTPIAQQPRFLREARTREERVARLLSTFEAEVPETTQADAGAKGGLDSEKPGVVEFAVVSALGHLSFKLNDGWRQQYEKLARFADEMQAHPDVRATQPKV